jgi:hypothetical protein
MGEREYRVYLPNTLNHPSSPKRVLVDEAHYNELSLDWTRAQEIAAQYSWAEASAYFLGVLQSKLVNEFILERNTNQPLSSSLLANYDALIIPPYPHFGEFSNSEVAAVQDFVASGKGLIVVGDCGWTLTDFELLTPYGLAFNPRCLFAPKPEWRGDFTLTSLNSHPSLESLSELFYNWGQPINIWGSATWLVDTQGFDVWEDSNDSGIYEAGVDDLGPFNVVAAADTGTGRIVAYGDNSIDDGSLTWSNNDNFFRKLLRWVTGGTSP